MKKNLIDNEMFTFQNTSQALLQQIFNSIYYKKTKIDETKYNIRYIGLLTSDFGVYGICLRRV